MMRRARRSSQLFQANPGSQGMDQNPTLTSLGGTKCRSMMKVELAPRAALIALIQFET